MVMMMTQEGRMLYSSNASASSFKVGVLVFSSCWVDDPHDCTQERDRTDQRPEGNEAWDTEIKWRLKGKFHCVGFLGLWGNTG